MNNRPLSFHPGTTIITRRNEHIEHSTLEALFMTWQIAMSKLNIVTLETNSEIQTIDVESLNIEVYGEGQWSVLKKISRHYIDNKLLRFETQKGNIFVVTRDQLCVVSKWTETYTQTDPITQIETEYTKKFTGRRQLQSSLIDKQCAMYSHALGSVPLANHDLNINADKAYTIGALIGDGSISGGMICFHQHNALCSHFAEKFRAIYGELYKQDTWSFICGNDDDVVWCRNNIGNDIASRSLPPAYLEWNREAQCALLAGLIDTEGEVDKTTGLVSMQVTSLGLVQQVAEFAQYLGFSNIRTFLVANNDNFVTPTLYGVEFHLTQGAGAAVVNRSVRLKMFEDVLYKEAGGSDALSDDVIKIELLPYKDNVYDIETASGIFYTNGMSVGLQGRLEN